MSGGRGHDRGRNALIGRLKVRDGIGWCTFAAPAKAAKRLDYGCGRAISLHAVLLLAKHTAAVHAGHCNMPHTFHHRNVLCKSLRRTVSAPNSPSRVGEAEEAVTPIC